MAKIDHTRPPSSDGETPVRLSALVRLRNYFLTGLVIAGPLAITIYLAWSFISLLDRWAREWVMPFVPELYNPERYFSASLPGVGVLFALFFITLLGFLAANIVGRTLVAYGEFLLGRMPLVRNLYGALKQIFQTILSERGENFQHVALTEYPRRGLWAIVFVSTTARGEIRHHLADGPEEVVSVFLPTTPNPTSGFLLYVRKSDLIYLDMTVEDAAKLVISAGLVAPEFTPNGPDGMSSVEGHGEDLPPTQPDRGLSGSS